MIPPRVLKQLAERLSKQTQLGAVTWSRASADVQRYVAPLASGQLMIQYSPSRGGPDTIELAIRDHSTKVIGALVAAENEPTYDVLADLLFEIQRKSDPGMYTAVTDEILRLLKS